MTIDRTPAYIGVHAGGTPNEVNMNRPTAFLMTGTPSYDDTAQQIKMAFDELGFDAEFDAHAFAGPVEIIETVAVSAPVVTLFNAMISKVGEDAYSGLKRLVVRILNASRKGSYSTDNAVELRDTEGRMQAELLHDLPETAYRQLIPLFMTYLAQNPPIQPGSTKTMYRPDGHVVHWLDGSGPRLVWSKRWNRWLAYAGSAYTYDLPARRLPPIASRVPVQSPAELSAPSNQQRAELYRASSSGSSVIFRQRATIALQCFQGAEPSHLARSLIVSEELVRAVEHDYVSHGLPGLRPSSASATPSQIPTEIATEVLTIVQTSPSEWQLTDDAWTLSSLARFIVNEAVIEDVSHRALKALLRRRGSSKLRMA